MQWLLFWHLRDDKDTVIGRIIPVGWASYCRYVPLLDLELKILAGVLQFQGAHALKKTWW